MKHKKKLIVIAVILILSSIGIAKQNKYHYTDEEIIQIAYNPTSELESIAFNHLFLPYKFGGTSYKGIDCSAFVQKVYKELNIELPRTAREQYKIGKKVNKLELQPGDLVFFKTYAKYVSHVAIYIGEGRMIHASSRSKKVTINSIDEPFYSKRFVGAKRIAS